MHTLHSKKRYILVLCRNYVGPRNYVLSGQSKSLKIIYFPIEPKEPKLADYIWLSDCSPMLPNIHIQKYHTPVRHRISAERSRHIYRLQPITWPVHWLHSFRSMKSYSFVIRHMTYAWTTCGTSDLFSTRIRQPYMITQTHIQIHSNLITSISQPLSTLLLLYINSVNFTVFKARPHYLQCRAMY